MYGYIYMWINKINNHKYIGKHKYDKLEWDPNYITSGELIQKKMKEYGIENFERVMLDVCDSLEELNEAERYWIAEFETYIEWNKGGYNLTLGGDGCDGYAWTDEQKNSLKNTVLKKYEDNPHILEQISSNLKKYYKENPEKRKENNNAIKTALNKPESKEKRSKIHKELWNKSGYKEKQSKKTIDNWKDEDIRNRRCSGIKNGMSTPEYKEKHSKRISKQNAGRKWMTKNGENKFVKPDEVQSLLEIGWNFGKTRKKSVNS